MRATLSCLTAISLLALGAFVQVPEARALPLGDIVFMIDESGSMGADIAVEVVSVTTGGVPQEIVFGICSV